VYFLCTPALLLLVVEVVSKPPLVVECGVVVLQCVDVSGSFADGTCATAPGGNHSCALPDGDGNLTSFVLFLAGIVISYSFFFFRVASLGICSVLSVAASPPVLYTPHIHIISVLA